MRLVDEILIPMVVGTLVYSVAWSAIYFFLG